MSSTPAASSLSFYRSAPQRRVALDDFGELGYKRLELLSRVNSRWCSDSILKKVQNNLMDDIAEVQELVPSSNVDILSHYALRLAFCRHRGSNGWNWLVTAEEKLQAIRLGRLPPFAAVALLSSEGIKYELVHTTIELDTTQQTIYRVPFADAPALVKYRESGTGTNEAGRSKLDVAEIDQVAEKHFPLCMKQLHRKLRENHHLKYVGRVQYRMFLKGAGFSVHECIQFFRREFIKKIPAAKFDKEYTYHIRHSYGLEGSRKHYAPLDCERIISGSTPSHGQYHGCPFKHWDRVALQDELCRLGLSLHTSMAITQQASMGHCQSACKALFDETHPSSAAYNTVHTCYKDTSALPGHPNVDIVIHPNLYLDASMATLD
ncbi:unnamed protein product [Peronospora destructor]|uniref:DNA primase large subunit C-terminal domain-containing protein n=1 Tax=Peronospora destructor TaxID=86335 RepID=A0AAV0TBU9_9STRA|nr:unnamed protein product [Peronospora destructor]